jgi:hypothetical protein
LREGSREIVDGLRPTRAVGASTPPVRQRDSSRSVKSDGLRHAKHHRTRADPLLRAPRRGVDLILDRSTRNRSQLLFTTARG